MGVTFEPFRAPLLAVIGRLDEAQAGAAITASPIPELWPTALQNYRNSGSYRGSEANFSQFITPFTGGLAETQLDELLDAVIGNNQNYAAAATSGLLATLLSNSGVNRRPSAAARNRFHLYLRRRHHLEQFDTVFGLFGEDGWVAPPAPPVDDDEV